MASSCCHSEDKQEQRKPDWLFRVCLLLVSVLYLAHWLAGSYLQGIPLLEMLAHHVFEFVNIVWWGVLMGILMIAVLSRIPRDFVMSILGQGSGLNSLWRATFAGLLLDLCSHGILMVGAKLYERGASTAQLMAFLIASPWNSLSMTIILISLIGWFWTLAFIILSMLIAIITGVIVMWLEKSGKLPANPQRHDLPEDFRFWREARAGLKEFRLTPGWIKGTLIAGVRESRMVLRWILLGVLLASVLRVALSPEQFGTWFGPTLIGLALTVLLTTILEVCSEGSSPIAADILTRAGAPGNSFVFLMGGVATDYTELMVLRETTRSWKISLMLPLLTLPQVLLAGVLINYFAL